MLNPLPGDIFAPGEVLNNTFEILGVLGRGGTGEVYKARNQVFGRIVAIKALKSEFSGDETYLALMRREDRMRDIVHDAVVRYSDGGRAGNGHAFLVMEFVDGPSLAERMASRLDARDLLVIGHRVASGLVATHASGIVHRDLSPDNIILREGKPEEAVIIDFGIARDMGEGAKTIVGPSFAGKYEYAAPEQIRGRAEPASDLYALGATLLAAWRGQVPFRGRTPEEMIRAKEMPLDTAGMPEPLAEIVAWLTAPRPEDRAASATEAEARFAEALRPRVEARRGRTAATASAGGALRRPALAGAALAIAALAAWFGGLGEMLLTPDLPVQTPYTFSAARTAEGTSFAGYAPDEQSAAQLRALFPGGTGLVTVAAGAPREDWAAAIGGLVGKLTLDEWSLEISDRAGRIEAFAPDAATRDAAQGPLVDTIEDSGFDITTRIVTGPKELERGEVRALLARLETCGPLDVAENEPVFALGARMTVTGAVADAADTERIRDAVETLAGDRSVTMATVALNPDICAVRNALPEVEGNGLSVWLGNGDTGEANLSGIYRSGENPIADIRIPEEAEGHLYVVVVENGGDVHSILPNRWNPEDRLDRLGSVTGGIRTIRVLHTRSENAADATRFAALVDEEFGKMELIAIVTDAPLFAHVRVQEESSGSLLKALTERLSDPAIGVRAIASRILEGRPPDDTRN